eukprot:GHVT01096030.1.p1 GENE.GHVT01096030.1~~GHVT01096030.1.p1  ORF type:complete len:123 (+),score=15.85 GHVT01096030.1:363-731(+)
MPFDRFRRPPPWYDPERPRYRYFRNRSRAQTRILSWAALVGSVAIVYASSFMPFVNAKDTDPKFELPHHYNMKQIHSKYALSALSERFYEQFVTVRRRALGLPARPSSLIIIRDPEEEGPAG